MKFFEKFAAFLFLLLLIGMIAFLTFVPVPEESKQVILIIIGGLMTSAATALPKLFGSEDLEKEAQRRELETLKTQYRTLKQQFDELTSQLIRDHVLIEGGPRQIAKYPESRK